MAGWLAQGPVPGTRRLPVGSVRWLRRRRGVGRPPGTDAEAHECLRARGTANGGRRVYGRQAPRAAVPSGGTVSRGRPLQWEALAGRKALDRGALAGPQRGEPPRPRPAGVWGWPVSLPRAALSVKVQVKAGGSPGKGPGKGQPGSPGREAREGGAPLAPAEGGRRRGPEGAYSPAPPGRGGPEARGSRPVGGWWWRRKWTGGKEGWWRRPGHGAGGLLAAWLSPPVGSLWIGRKRALHTTEGNGGAECVIGVGSESRFWTLARPKPTRRARPKKRKAKKSKEKQKEKKRGRRRRKLRSRSRPRPGPGRSCSRPG